MTWFCKFGFVIILIFQVKGEFSWSSPEYAAQASRTTCKPLQKLELATLRTKINSASIKKTSLGAVDNAEVCGGLCCEMETCDLAEFNKERQCFAVQCGDLKSCDVASNGDSVILTFSRKSGSDVWTRSFKGGPTNTRSQIVQETADKKNVVTTGDGPQPNIMEEINAEIIARIKSTEEKLAKKWTMKEMAEADFTGNTNKKNEIEKENASLHKEIQSITGEHYMKADDKDITALQENDTSIVHKHQRRHDIRHNIISPITIGAFTCMAVIAVSGFAMAIIKYKKERKEVEDKQTQLP